MKLFDIIFGKAIDRRIAAYQNDLITKHCDEVDNIYRQMRGWRHDYHNHILGLKDITSIVVTHALDEALLKRYDGIITLKNGSIVETGTFDELIAEKGYFYSLFTISQ